MHGVTMKMLVFLDRFFSKKFPPQKIIKIYVVGAELFHVDHWPGSDVANIYFLTVVL